MKKSRPEVEIDLKVFQVPDLYEELRVSPEEVVNEGSVAEMRSLISDIGFQLVAGKLLNSYEANWLGQALFKIAHGADANRELGLTRKKKFGVQDDKATRYLVDDLMKQGLTKVEAENLLGSVNLRTGEIWADYEATGGDALRKRLRRSKPTCQETE